MASITQPSVSAGDRLSFTVFLAIALHVFIVLTEFINEDPLPSPKTMEITLSRFDDKEAPKRADFLAQTNQQGAGSLEEKAQLSSPTQSIDESMRIQESSAPPKPQELTQKYEQAIVVTQQSERLAKARHVDQLDFTLQEDTPEMQSLIERSLQIAELEASFDNQLQQYARKPRITRLTAASTMKAVDARYVEQVVAKIERTGKQHFPRDGSKKLYGKPRVAIALYSDGSLRDVSIMHSSGNLVLDAKTTEIVRRAAPFAPFPKEVRKERDVLELIRTFSYSRSGVSSF